MSSLPQASIAVWTSFSGVPSLVRSPAKTVVSPSIPPAACSATSPSRSLIRTFAPCEASNSAVARPMPRAEPVTIATLSSRTPIRRLLVLVSKEGGEPYVAALARVERVGLQLEDDVERAAGVGAGGRAGREPQPDPQRDRAARAQPDRDGAGAQTPERGAADRHAVDGDRGPDGV